MYFSKICHALTPSTLRCPRAYETHYAITIQYMLIVATRGRLGWTAWCRDTSFVSRHPLGCYPCRDMEFMSQPGTNWSQPQPCHDTKLDVATWDPSKLVVRALKPCRALCCVRSCAVTRSRSAARQPCAHQAQPVTTSSLGHDPGLGMGSSPCHSSLHSLKFTEMQKFDTATC